VQECTAGRLASYTRWTLSYAGAPARGRFATTFRRHFYRLWIDAALAQRPALARFRGLKCGLDRSAPPDAIRRASHDSHSVWYLFAMLIRTAIAIAALGAATTTASAVDRLETVPVSLSGLVSITVTRAPAGAAARPSRGHPSRMGRAGGGGAGDRRG
jgi:hypothetical protein